MNSNSDPHTTASRYSVEFALGLEVGHGPPFTEEELAEVRVVSVRYASGFDALKGCPNLRTAGLTGCDAPELPWSEFSPALKSLNLEFSSIRSLDSLRILSRLGRLNVRATLVESIAPLLELPVLRTLSLGGTPLDEHSYYEVLPELRSRPPEKRDRPATIDPYLEADWLTSRALALRGIDVVYVGDRVLAPGLAYSDMPDLHSYAVSHDDVKRVLDQVDDGDLKGFMDRCRDIAHGK